MTDPLDSLEAELTAMAPRAPSAELQKRIANQLDSGVAAQSWPSRTQLRSSKWPLALAAIAIAACLLFIILSYSSKPTIAPTQPKLVSLPASIVLADSLPSAWAYHRAITTSSQSLDLLLDQHANQNSAADDSLIHVSAFRSFTSVNQSDFGGL